MPTNPRRNPAHVLAGDAPGGVIQIVGKQVGIILVIFVTYLVLWLIMDDAARLPGTKVQPAPQPGLPAGIVHEVKPTAELTAMRERDAKILGSYGEVEGAKGVYHMPIEVAMDKLLGKGLPTKVIAMPEWKPTEANGGQQLAVVSGHGGSQGEAHGAGLDVAPRHGGH